MRIRQVKSYLALTCIAVASLVFIREFRRARRRLHSKHVGDVIDASVTRDSTPAADDVIINERVYSERDFAEALSERRRGVTKNPGGRDVIKIALDGGGAAMTVEEYKRYRADLFIRQYANPVPKNGSVPTLTKYSDDMAVPDPFLMVKDNTMTLNKVDIDKAMVQIEVEQIFNGDDDLNKMELVQNAVTAEQALIPNIVHYIWFGCRKYKIHHYMSMLSVLKYQKPSLILLHTNCKPNGTYWNEFAKAAQSRLLVVKRSPPTQIWNRAVQRVEHQSDVARLHILLQVGGIYLDDDVIVLKSLDELRHDDDMVLGEENYDALANSIILANKNSWFLKRWFQEYQHFNDSRWSDSSCFVPWSLWKFFPSTLRVVKETMLRPNWEEIELMYHEVWDWSHNFCVHLYSRFMQTIDGSSERSLLELAVLNTTYGQIARHVFWDDKHPRDIKDWILETGS